MKSCVLSFGKSVADARAALYTFPGLKRIARVSTPLQYPSAFGEQNGHDDTTLSCTIMYTQSLSPHDGCEATPGKRNSLARESILIVEDDENLRQVTKTQLDRAGYHTTTATDVPEALARLSASPVDLVITDINLPGESGLDLLKKIRSEYPETLVVLFTGYGTLATAVDAMKLGAYEYLTKPVHPNDLKTLINRAFEDRHHRMEEHRLQLLCNALEDQVAQLKHSKTVIDSEGTYSMADYRMILGAAVHDLRGELFHIDSSLKDLLETAEPSPAARGDIEMIERSLGYARAVLQRLLTFLELGTPYRVRIALSDLLRQAKLLLKPRLRSNIHLYMELAPDARRLQVLGDRDQVISVLLELVKNASKAIGRRTGSIRISARIEDSLCHIYVKDDGPGIPHNFLTQLLEGQVPSENGAGLGLYLSAGSMRAIGGGLQLVSSSAAGTEFRLVLPIETDVDPRA